MVSKWFEPSLKLKKNSFKTNSNTLKRSINRCNTTPVRQRCCSLWSNKRNAGGLHGNEWPLTLLPTPRWHTPYLISLYDVGVSGADAEKSPLCIMKIDYTWIDYRMAQEVRGNPIVYIMSHSHSVSNLTIVTQQTGTLCERSQICIS